MSEMIWRDCILYLGGYDLTTKTNSLALDYSAELKDITHFTDDTRRRIAGLKNFAGSYVGFFDMPIPDEISQQKVGLSDVPVSLMPVSSAAGEIAYMANPIIGSYQIRAEVGEVLGIEARFNSNGPLVRGIVGLNKATRSASGNGTAYNLGAVAEGQRVYAALHIFGKSGTTPSLTVVIQSDSASGFPSPADVITFPAQSDVGAVWLYSNGPITDTWWRVNYTIGGTSPSFTFAVMLGIL